MVDGGGTRHITDATYLRPLPRGRGLYVSPGSWSLSSVALQQEVDPIRSPKPLESGRRNYAMFSVSSDQPAPGMTSPSGGVHPSARIGLKTPVRMPSALTVSNDTSSDARCSGDSGAKSKSLSFNGSPAKYIWAFYRWIEGCVYFEVDMARANPITYRRIRPGNNGQKAIPSILVRNNPGVALKIRIQGPVRRLVSRVVITATKVSLPNFEHGAR